MIQDIIREIMIIRIDMSIFHGKMFLCKLKEPVK